MAYSLEIQDPLLVFQTILQTDSMQLCLLLSPSQPVRPGKRGRKAQPTHTRWMQASDHASPASCSIPITDNPYSYIQLEIN